MAEPTIKKLKYLIADEKKAVKMYYKYGYHKLARDEARHKKFLMKKLKHEIKEK